MIKHKDLLLYILSRLRFIDLFLEFGHFVLVEQEFELEPHDPTSLEELELLNDLIFALDNFVVELRNHLVLHHIVEKRVWDVFLSSFLVEPLLKDFGETVPPSAEALRRLQDVSGDLVELGSQLINGWVESDTWMVVGGGHLH